MRYLDPEASVGERVADLLPRMSLHEKIGQLQQRLHGWHAYTSSGDGVPQPSSLLVDEAGRWGGIGALYGLFRADPWSGVDWSTGIAPHRMSEAARAVQDVVLDASRHGIPALLTEEAPHGHQGLGATVLPTNLAIGATWNPELLREASAAVALWLRGAGVHLALSSGLDLARDPRWGRSEECYSEDPFLASTLVRASVLGFQGEPAAHIGHGHVGVVLKHFAAQGASIGGRNTAGAPIGPRELAEVHLPAARAGVRAGAMGIMASYNDIDGIPSIANHALLTSTLRDEWGFQGVVMADGGAIDRLGHTGASPELAAALALTAGVDLSLWDESFTRLEEAVKRGLVDGASVDDACARVLSAKFRLGLFEDPLPSVGELTAGGPARDLSAISRAMADECLVLLADDGILPLDSAIRRIAVIGPNADDFDALLGDYVAPQAPGAGLTIAGALRESALDGVEVRTTRGSALVSREPIELDRARALAEWADVVVLALGGSSRRVYGTAFGDNGAVQGVDADPGMTAGEGVDLAEVALDPAQVELARVVASAGTPVVTVVIAGRAHGIHDIMPLSNAVVFAWYPGPYGALALADALLGRTVIGGALPVSLPRTSATLPIAHDERLELAGTYADARGGALFPLGFAALPAGISVGAPAVVPDRISWSPSTTVPLTIEVRNTGDRVASHVVTLFASRPLPGMWPRRRELVAFERVWLEPGETREVQFDFGVAWAAPHFERFAEPLTATLIGQGGSASLRIEPN